MCVFAMVVGILPTGFGQKNHRKDAPHFEIRTKIHIGIIHNSVNFILAHLFTIPLNKMNPFQIDETDLRRSSEGLMALLLSLSWVFKRVFRATHENSKL